MKKFISLFIILTVSLLIGCTDTSSLDEPLSTQENNNSSSEKEVIATIYASDSQAENLVDKKVTLKKLDAASLFDELKSLEVISKDTILNSFNTYTSKNNELVGVIDVSNEFYSFNLGSSGEILMLDSIAKTYIENFKLDKFKILVNGKDYESGHLLFEENDFFTRESLYEK